MKLLPIILKKSLAVFLAFLLLFTSVAPGIQAPLSPQKAEATGASCGDTKSHMKAQVGGVALDQAATFLAEMDDITGAYYDDSLDRIVFVGKTNTTLPEFDKDDLAVTIKSVIFNKTNPAISIEDGAVVNDGIQEVFYYGGIENTNFGKVLFEADMALKRFVLGFDENDNRVSTSVTGYKSIIERYLDKNPGPGQDAMGRTWITPKDITLKKDDVSDSFVFNSVQMEVNFEPRSLNNDPLYNQAGEEFVAHHTQNYDAFAEEIPSYKDTKKLAKIVSVVKWLSDNGIATDFHWANDYTPKYVETPTEITALSTYVDSYNGYTYTTSGGIQYYDPNDYISDDGTASSLKNASEAVNSPKEDIHWTFTENGEQYESVAVAADAFRSLGAYSTSENDFEFPTAGDLKLAFARSYSSYSGGQNGVGRGWSFMPAQLIDNQPIANGIAAAYCDAGDTYLKRSALAFNINGQRETFTYDDANQTECKYLPDEATYHSDITTESPSSTRTIYKVTTKDQTIYTFEDLVDVELVTNYELRLISIEDKNGNKLNYNYESSMSAKLISVSDDNNHSIAINYNSDNLISSVQDWAGRTVGYTYDTQGNLLTVTDPEGEVTTYTYDTNNKLATITDRAGQTVVENTYTPEAKIATQSAVGGRTTTYAYDNDNRTVTATDNLSRSEIITYDEKARVLEQEDPSSNSITYTYGTEYAPLTVTDKRNNTTTYTYDSNGNTTSITFPDTKQITYQYDSKNNPTEEFDTRYSPTKATNYTYDSNGNLTQLQEASKITGFTYNTQGELTSVTDPLSKTTTYIRNSFGNILTETDPLSKTKTYEYDTIGRLTKQTDANNRMSTYAYDNNSNIVTITDAAGTTTNVYDEENRLEQTTLPNNAVTQYAYNTAGSLTSVTDATNNVTSYGYDQYQNMLSREDALDRTTQYAYDQMNRRTDRTTPLGKVAQWEYDTNGNITKRIDENLDATTYSYDAFNRLTTITYPDTQTVIYTYDNRGNMTQMVDPIGTTTYTYDTHDRLLSVTNPYNQSITYTYDAADNLTKITYPDSQEVTYTYNDANQLASVVDWNNDTTSFTYHDNGLLATRSLPNGIVTSYLYDNANRLDSLEHVKSETTLAKFDYERDAVGNITEVTEEGTLLPTPPPPPGPDFVITDMYTTPASPEAGTEFEVSIKVKNEGNVGTGLIIPIFAFYNDPTQPPDYSTMPNHTKGTNVDLDPGEEMIITKGSFDFSTSGIHTIWALADRQQDITEQNENNNLYGPFEVQIVEPTPTPTSSATPTPTPSVSKPDLEVTSITLTPSTITAEEEFEIDVNVKNIGNTTTGNDEFNVGFYFDRPSAPSPSSEDEWEEYDDPVDVNQTVIVNENNLEFEDDGSRNIWIIVDMDDEIDESNESNNVYGPYNVNVVAHGAPVTIFAGNPLMESLKYVKALFTVKTAHAQLQLPQYINTYTYDPLGRVLSASQSATSNIFEYTYDSVGNRLTSEVNDVASNYAYNIDNQLATYNSISYTHDNKGNQTAAGTKTFSYNFDNMLTQYVDSGVTTQYTYDGNADRLAKTVDSTTTRFVNDVSSDLTHVLVETDNANALQNAYVYGNGLTSEGGTSASSREYYLEDGMGNIRVVVDSSGNKLSSHSYDPYGNPLADTGSSFQFKGEQIDQGGMYFMRARYYDPATGRFIAKDPVEGTLTNPQSQNGYSYVYGNPINYSDPSGEYLETGWDVANIVYDIATCDWGALAYDTTAALVPGLPAGLTKVAKGADAVQAAKQFTKLSEGEIKMLQKKGVNIEEQKQYVEGGASKADLYKNPKTGEIFVMPKSGGGAQRTDLNIRNY